MPVGFFVHLHLHTEYSLLDCAVRMKELMKKAAEMKMPAVAITDHGISSTCPSGRVGDKFVAPRSERFLVRDRCDRSLGAL
jgi:histidinol phosphatase-like PHP family hydrolase